MARKKKNDFWDEPEELELPTGDGSKGHANKEIVDEEWSAVKCLPIKLFMRLLLMVACMVALGSAYIAYEYVQDRYAGGSYSTDFYDSASFAEEYNKNVDQLLQLIEAMEEDPTVTQSGQEELLATLVENYMGKDTNFAFMILDSDNYKIASSGDDAKTRIEASTHYVVISNTDGVTTVQSPISGSLLDKSTWNSKLSETTNTYIIYTAVDDELTQTDGFYTAMQSYEKMESYFSMAKFVGIGAAVLFILCLIFCIVSTGMKRGYDGVCLSWFDRVYTEPALVIMLGVAGAIGYGMLWSHRQDGSMYQYMTLGFVVLAYIWIIRSYFSLVRRIKSGTLFRSSIIGTIARGIGSLPSPFNIILGVLILLGINGALVYGVIFMRQYTVKDIPIIFIIAPIVIVIELLALITHGIGDDSEEEAPETDAKAAEATAANEDSKGDTKPRINVVEENKTKPSEYEQTDWESIDLGKAVAEAELKRQQEASRAEQPFSVENTYVAEPSFVAPVIEESPVRASIRPIEYNQTEMISLDEVKRAIMESGFTPDVADEPEAVTVAPVILAPEEELVAAKSEPVVQKVERVQPEPVVQKVERVQPEPVVQKIERVQQESAAESFADDILPVNFVQLNKDVRKEFKAAFKERGIGVTVRAPEKPVCIDIDKNSFHIAVSDIFTQVARLCAGGERTYAEIYLQGGKVVYIVKIPVAPELKDAAAKAAAGDGSFNTAKKIIEANDGRFVLAMDGNILKVGMMIDAAR